MRWLLIVAIALATAVTLSFLFLANFATQMILIGPLIYPALAISLLLALVATLMARLFR